MLKYQVMNPNQEEYSIDYLNQISTAPKKSGLDKKFLFLIGGGLGLAILLVIGLVIYSSISTGGASPAKLQTLFVRLETLGEVSKNAQKNIKNNPLRVANANLTIFLTNANRDIVAPLTDAGVDTKKIDKTVTAKYSSEKLDKSLEDARLNALYDRTYAREINYELETLEALMKEIYSSTKNVELKEFLNSTDDNFSTIRTQLSTYSDTTS